MISLKLPMFTDTLALKVPFAFPNLLSIRSEFTNCQLNGPTNAQDLKNTTLTHYGFLAIVRSLNKLRVISFGSNYFNTLQYIDDG